MADFIGFRVIPVFAMGFVVAYWTMGMMKYYSPDWSAYAFLLPSFQVSYVWDQIYSLKGILIGNPKMVMVKLSSN